MSALTDPALAALIERAEAEVARQEWQELNPEIEPPNGLVVREPQVRQAEAELATSAGRVRVRVYRSVVTTS